ncbi:MAG: DUF115 domain-containing protein [Spirochaetaceae bacterium]|jgi:hypothetical protein|nr:DUF115 domain-containing protein [Spirochaetaceae bacterium]
MTDIQQSKAARRGFSVYYKGKTLLSTVDPVAQGERPVRAAPRTERTLYLCPSPLYGYGLSALLGDLPLDSAVLCVEADPGLLDLSTQAMQDLLGNPALGLIDEINAVDYVRKTWGSRRFRRVEVIHLSGGWQLFPEVYKDIAKKLQQDFAVDWSNAMTLTKLGRRYILNAVRNLARIPQARSFGSLAFGDAPVLTLGAGPSLDRVLDALPAGPRPFKIVCVDTALPALKARNLKPDLAVALESQHWNLRDFLGLGDWELPLAMDLSALPALWDLLGGKTILFATLWTDLRFFRRLKTAGLLPEVIPPLGSVGLTAVAAALRVSSGMVVTAGLDFSYTLDGFHARSTPSHTETLNRQSRFRSMLNGDIAFRDGSFTATAKSGETVRTNPALQFYRDVFERIFAPEPRLLDIAGPGLALGTRTLSLEEALEVLSKGSSEKPENDFRDTEKKPKSAAPFLRRERDMLIALRDILTGAIPDDPGTREILLDEADYLWSHFPDCAGTGTRRPLGRDVSFLKRVRAEIDPLIRRFNIALETLPSS